MAEVFDKFLNEVSYKFYKGYPDMNDPKDIKLMEHLISQKGINIIFENRDLINSLESSNVFDGFGNLETSGATTIKLILSDIPSRGDKSDEMRNDVYGNIEQFVNDEENEDFDNYRKEVTGSSLGSAIVNFKGKDYRLIIKGASDDTKSDTDIKEALVSLFYASSIESAFTKENYTERIEQLIPLTKNGIPGETSESSQKVSTYLEATIEKPTSLFINFINQPLSSALTIKQVYPGQKLIRNGNFNLIRNKAQKLTGLPADKWNPGDLYVQLKDVDNVEGIDNIELINDMFNDNWGDDSKPLTSVSLKQADAQGGKAKALLNKYTSAKEDYNLTKDEIGYNNQQYKNGIIRLRDKINSLVNTNSNIEYTIEKGELKDEIRFLRGKYAALKSIEFLFRQFPNDKVDEAIVALTGFALSLTGVNPTFFKVTGQKSGQKGRVDKYSRGQNVILYNVDGEYEPIVMKDTLNFGGLHITFKLEKGGKIYSVAINARNNGNTQGTLEVQKIKPI